MQKTTSVVTIDVGRESIDRAKKRLREALEGCEAGTFRIGDHTETGLLAELIEDMRAEPRPTLRAERDGSSISVTRTA